MKMITQRCPEEARRFTEEITLTFSVLLCVALWCGRDAFESIGEEVGFE